MENITILAQLIIATSIVIVWVFRFDNIVVEFKQYGLSDLIRSMVGASKVSLATLLVVGIFYEEVVFVSALLMAFLMICAQVAHIVVKNPLKKYIIFSASNIITICSCGRLRFTLGYDINTNSHPFFWGFIYYLWDIFFFFQKNEVRI